jgi:hypothetical protein
MFGKGREEGLANAGGVGRGGTAEGDVVVVVRGAEDYLDTAGKLQTPKAVG